jgi:hypothetical protein
MGYLTFFLLIAAMALVVPAAVLALGLAQRAAGSAEPWQRPDRARSAFSIFPRWVRKATIALAIVLPACIFVGAMIASVGGAFYPPVVEIAVPYVCNGAPESRTQDYSYRPGQAGVAHNFQCTDAGGDQRDITWPAFVAATLFYSVIVLLLTLLLLGLKRALSRSSFSTERDKQA